MMDELERLRGHFREVREREHCYQLDLAERAGIGDNTYTDWERGLRNPRIDTLVLAADALGYRFVLVPKEDKQ